MTLCGDLRGVAAGAENIQQHAHGIDIRPAVRLGDAVLLRGGVARSAQHQRIGGVLFLDKSGGVKVDEHRLVFPEDHVFGLHIPVNGSKGVQCPQSRADLSAEPPGLLLGEDVGPQQCRQGIALNVLLQHRHVSIFLTHLQNFRQVGTGDLQKLPVNLSVALISSEYEAFSGLLVAQQPDAAPGAGFELFYDLIMFLYGRKQEIIHNFLFSYAASILIFVVYGLII